MEMKFGKNSIQQCSFDKVRFRTNSKANFLFILFPFKILELFY